MIQARAIVFLLLAISTPLASWAQEPVSIESMQRVSEWEKLAPGVHRAVIGDHSQERRYSDLAGAAPRWEALKRLRDVPLAKALEQVRFRITKDGKLELRISTDPGERIYGFGLQFDRTVRSGQITELKVDHFAKGGGATHAPVPFYVSSAGYGLFFNTAKFIKIYNQVGNRKDAARVPAEVDRNPPDDEAQPGPWLAVPPGDALEAYIHGAGMELLAFSGTGLLDIVSRYNLYCGGGAMPPLWGLGFWHRVPSKFSADETREELEQFRQRDIPLDVIGLEPGWQTKSYPCTFEWQPKRFPDPAGFVAELLEDGLHLNLWENPYVSKHASIYEALYPLSASHMVWLGIVPDYTLEAARKILVEQHKREHFDLGISGYKIDEVDGYDVWLWPDHASFPSGTSGEVMRQTYGLLVQNMLYKDLFHANNQRTYSLVRASNGAASNYPFVLYSDSYRHREYITGLSSASLAGILWCPEIRSAKSSREWINRMQTACLSPLAMLNAWSSGTKPWSYPDATDAVRRIIQLRMRLLPYLYGAFHDYFESGIPPVRAMLLEDPESSRRPGKGIPPLTFPLDSPDFIFQNQFNEDASLYMLGPDILVAPFEGTSVEREVQLPPGEWHDFYSGQSVGNGTKFTVTAEQTGDMPALFVRSGALIPMLAKSVNRTASMRGAALEIRRYGSGPGSCRLYEDDGVSYDFERGAYRLRQLSVLGGKLLEVMLNDQAPAFYGELTLRQMTAEVPAGD